MSHQDGNLRKKTKQKKNCLIRYIGQHLSNILKRNCKFVEKTTSNSPKMTSVTFPRSDWLLCLISIYNYAYNQLWYILRSLSPRLLNSLYKLGLRHRIIFYWYKEKIYTNYGSSTSCWKTMRWTRYDLIILMMDTSILTRNHLQNSEAVADVPRLKIPTLGTSLLLDN